MKSIQVEFDKASQKIKLKEGAETENWADVCQRFNDDVSRVCEVSDHEGYTAVFECCDDDNRPFYFLVNEDRALYRMKHRRFLDNLGLK